MLDRFRSWNIASVPMLDRSFPKAKEETAVRPNAWLPMVVTFGMLSALTSEVQL